MIPTLPDLSVFEGPAVTVGTVAGVVWAVLNLGLLVFLRATRPYRETPQ